MVKTTSDRIKDILLLLLSTALIIGCVLMKNLNDDLLIGRHQRQTFNAEQRFILCSRKGITDPRKVDEFHRTCVGYQTLAQSYKTEKNR